MSSTLDAWYSHLLMCISSSPYSAATDTVRCYVLVRKKYSVRPHLTVCDLPKSYLPSAPGAGAARGNGSVQSISVA